ncbi:sugar-binding transcriptional regulator [Sediminibacillus albus]|uniref:Central glycolytic genes regulator n=1 Tax=Sediminibacillus albus TaxID=407036 RepID=A0A1G8YS94_9BACI|nr:sugar-binding domain-containing protein [Sediminibacillus albus]SDK05653.1 central glycolytic genes regulator [Sediminibacillus albus]
MRALIDLQKKLFPDLLDVMQRRYKILHYIHLMEPIGRRSLADNIEMAERLVRSEIDFLNSHGFLDITSKGMLLTPEGTNVLAQLREFIKEVSGFSVLEQSVKDKLHVDHVVVVPGNSDELDWVKQEMGKAAVDFLRSILHANQTIAVTGGTSMAAVAEMMTPLERAENCMFVPARGGLGERVENQANTICAEMAKKANGEYRLLYVPDPLSEESYQSIIGEPSVKEILHLIKQADVVIHGIGDAWTMAQRRKASGKILQRISDGNAVSEAFGYYFNQTGDVIHKVRTVGLQLEDLDNSQCVVAVAGGKSKAQAIISYFKQGKSNVLVTDEGAAKELIRD